MKFFFRATVAGIQESLALGSLYSLADEYLKTYSHGALNVLEYRGDGRLVVIKAKSIVSVVALVPFEQDDGNRRFFLIEKFALGGVNSDSNLDLES